MEKYLHIGNNNIIVLSEVIGIFDYKILKNNLIKDSIIVNKNEFEENKIKSIIITKNNNQIRYYLSNISTNTLSKR